MSTQQVICADSLEFVKHLPRSCYDCVITDPPYGIKHPTNYKARGRGNLAECNDYAPVEGDDREFDPAYLLALEVPLVLWGANYFAHKLPPSSGWLVWDKKRPEGLDQSTAELAWSNQVKGVRVFRHLWNGMMKASEHGENYHPTQKPVALMFWTLRLKWLKGLRRVLDPYAGSSPVGVACKMLGIDYIGVELSEEYCKVASSRIDQAQPLSLEAIGAMELKLRGKTPPGLESAT